MKQRFFTALTALALAFSVTTGITAALVSVYMLPLSRPTVLFFWLVSAALGLLLLPGRKGPRILLGICAFALGFALCRPKTIDQSKSFLELITRTLNGVYHLGYLEFPGHSTGSTELPVAIYGSLLLLSVLRGVLARKSSALPLFLSLPPLLLCALMTDAPPKAWTILLWLGAMLTLLLTSGSRRNSRAQGLTLTAMALVPVALLCGLLCFLNPQQDYEDHARALRETCIRYLENRRFSPPPTADLPIPELDTRVDLSALNGARQAELPVLIVTAPADGPLYLRGQSFDRYTSKIWENTDSTPESFEGWGDSLGQIQIRTFALRSELCLPYYPGTGTVLSEGAVKNSGGLLSYSFRQYSHGSAASEETLRQCLQLPESASAWTGSYTFSGNTAAEIAQRIGDFVRNSAQYNKSAPRMPDTAEDFARWFLEDSDSGFCVHFATAATVLLRANGIPARYVTGFLCQVKAGEPTIVTSLQAHAWAEYYDRALGEWQILETTAPDTGIRPTPQPTETMPSTETPSVPTRPTSAPTAPPPIPQAQRRTAPRLSWLWLLFLPVLPPLRRLAVLFLRRERRRRASLNRRCLLYWVEAERLSRALGETPPEALQALAERARYSQHKLTPMELTPLTDYCRECRQKLDGQSLIQRGWNKYVRVIY